MPIVQAQLDLPSRDVIRQIDLQLPTIILPARWQSLHRHPQRNGYEPIHNGVVRIVELDVKRLDTRPTATSPVEEVLLADDPGRSSRGVEDGPVDRREGG